MTSVRKDDKLKIGEKEIDKVVKFEDILRLSLNFYCISGDNCDKYVNGILTSRYIVTDIQCTCIHSMRGHKCKHYRMKKLDFAWVKTQVSDIEVRRIYEELRCQFEFNLPDFPEQIFKSLTYVVVNVPLFCDVVVLEVEKFTVALINLREII